MRNLALALLGGVVLVTVGCSSSRSFSRTDVMADHIASVRPDGSRYSSTPTRVAARPAAPAVVTYASTTERYVPAPPPPPALPAMVTPVARPAATGTVVRAVARPAAPVRTAPRATTVRRAPTTYAPAPRRTAPRAARKSSGFKLFSGCAGGT